MPDSPSQLNATGAPLAGRSVVVTRTREQSRELADPLEALGAEVVACPVIQIVDPPDFGPIDDAIGHLSDYDWVVFTSANAVTRFFARLANHGVASDALSSARIAAVGSATARSLLTYGLDAELTPPMSFRAEALAEELLKRGVGVNRSVLMPRALEAREVLPEALRAAGATVDVAPVYRTVPAQPCEETIERLRTGGFDAVTFTSPSTVRNFLALLVQSGLDPAQVLGRVATASIGPVTTSALLDAGLVATVEATPSTVPELVKVLAERLVATSPGLTL